MNHTQALTRKALRLEYTLIIYNVFEGVVALVSGWRAGSIALVGFGLDSVIEVASAGVLIWRLKHEGSAAEGIEKEKKALFFVGSTFIALAAYILFVAGRTLLLRERPNESMIGIALAVASLAMMFFLGWSKRKVALGLGSRALEADAMETLVCAYLSFTLLLGLGLNAWAGWWWADPVAALAMLYFIIEEGREAIREAREHSARN